MIDLEKLIFSKCDPYTLLGTSICNTETCETCISRIRCCMKSLCIEIAHISIKMKKPIDVLFPSFAFLVDLIFDKEILN